MPHVATHNVCICGAHTEAPSPLGPQARYDRLKDLFERETMRLAWSVWCLLDGEPPSILVEDVDVFIRVCADILRPARQQLRCLVADTRDATCSSAEAVALARDIILQLVTQLRPHASFHPQEPPQRPVGGLPFNQAHSRAHSAPVDPDVVLLHRYLAIVTEFLCELLRLNHAAAALGESAGIVPLDSFLVPAGAGFPEPWDVQHRGDTQIWDTPRPWRAPPDRQDRQYDPFHVGYQIGYLAGRANPTAGTGIQGDDVSRRASASASKDLSSGCEEDFARDDDRCRL